MKTLYLIDGYAQFFRAYHAIRTPMTSPVTKEPTNATFGFVGMLLKVLRELKPDYLAVAIDVSGDRGTFRSVLYPAYKATRDEPPEDFRPQAARCIALLRELGIPVLGVEGFEADDVIATLADRIGAHTENIRVRIVSKDKDLQQLIVPTDPVLGGVEMYDVHTDELIDAAKLFENKGVTPEQVVDMLALMGDTVDNVPGVAGIGPKTAAQLIHEFGTLENVIAEARKEKGKIKGKRRENILAAVDQLPLSKQLVALRRDVPLEFDLRDAEIQRFRLASLGPLLKELGFGRYQDELKDLLRGGESGGESGGVRGAGAGDGSAAVGDDRAGGGSLGGEAGLFDSIAREGGAAAVRAVDGEYETVTSVERLRELVKEMERAEVFAIDTETTSLSPLRCQLCGISVSAAERTGAYIPVRSPESGSHLDEATVVEVMRPLLEDPARHKCGHNLKYDLLVLRRHGIELRGMVFDSMVASYLVDASRSSHSMDHLALALLGHTCISIKDLIGTGKYQKRFDEAPLEQAGPYAAEDADISLRLRNVLAPQLRAMKLDGLFEDVEMPLVRVLAELEWNGITLDPEELDRQAARLSERIESLRRRIIDAAPRPFNPDSPKQLGAILFGPADAPDPEARGLGIKPLKKTKTGHSTDVEVLEKLAADPSVESPVPGLIVEYRQLTKLVNTYLVALKEAIHPETGRVHASFHQTVAATGRLSSSDPNLQNIPIRTEVGREIRRAFVAAEGCVLIGADYSQIELRVLAHLSKDRALIGAFEAGEDIHRAVAAQIHGVKPEEVTSEQRNGAKMVNFGIVYGITAFGLARRLGISNTEAAQIIEEYKARFTGIDTFLQKCIRQAQRYGYVETILGRRRPIIDIDSNNGQRRALAERIAINSVVQGSAADLIKVAMIDIHRVLRPEPGEGSASGADAARAERLRGVKMLLQIHDELVFESPRGVADEAKAFVVERMEHAMKMDVPLRVEAAISETWFEGK